MLNKLGGIKLQSDAIRWLLKPAALKAELLQQISQAKSAITIAALYLEDDEAGREILTALLAAKANNPELDITVLVDFHRARRGLIGHKGDSGNYFMYREFIENAEQPIKILGVPVKSKEFLGVLHLKGFVIDDTVIFSGASLNNIYLHQGDKYRFDRYHVIESAELAHSMRQMVKDYIESDKAVTSLAQPKDCEVLPEKSEVKTLKGRLSAAEYEFTATYTGNRITPVVGLGRKNNKLNKLVIELVSETQESLFICTPYFNPPYILSRALSKQLKKGRRIDIVVGDKTANDFYIPPEKTFSTIGVLPYLYEQSLRKFAKRQQWAIEAGLLNIHLWKHDSNSYHLKGISSDNCKHLITGSNLNPRAWALDLENGLLLQDVEGVWRQQFIDEQAYILQHTQRLNHYREVETLKDYPKPVKKLMNRIRRLKADFLLKRIL